MHIFHPQKLHEMFWKNGVRCSDCRPNILCVDDLHVWSILPSLSTKETRKTAVVWMNLRHWIAEPENGEDACEECLLLLGHQTNMGTVAACKTTRQDSVLSAESHSNHFAWADPAVIALNSERNFAWEKRRTEKLSVEKKWWSSLVLHLSYFSQPYFFFFL